MPGMEAGDDEEDELSDDDEMPALEGEEGAKSEEKPAEGAAETKA